MRRKQLVQNNSQFAGYEVVRKLSTRHNEEREVYLVKCQSDSGCEQGDTLDGVGILTVFNLKAKRYEVDGVARKRVPDFIEEVKFLRECKSVGCFPEIIDCGIEKVGKKRLGWMVQRHVDGISLTDAIHMLGGFCMGYVVMVMKSLFVATELIARYTKGGGHYNINPDNILLDFDKEDLKGVYLIGLSDMGTSYYGTVPFTEKVLDRRFRAPETEQGIFNHLTDIFSLGLVMAMMITGDLGEDDSYCIMSHPGGIYSTDFRNLYMTQNRDNLSAAQRLILEKATDINPSGRFQSVDRFSAFVSKLANGKIKTKTHIEGAAALMPGANATATTEEVDNRFVRLDHKESQKVLTRETEIKKPLGGLDEVAGMSELKDLFRRDFIRIVRNPKVAKAYGIKPSNCTLLYGPQGCGKTFIAEKAAQESGLKYKIVNPSELGSIYIHGSQQKIAELFDEAEKKGPMILIFDEFDAIVPNRDSDLNGNQANEVNEMLTQLNNCASRGIYVLATTNRPSLLDPAIMRKGRVDRTVYVSLPDKEARKELFRLEIEKRPYVSIDYESLACATDNYTCSDISFIVEESARLCFEETLDRNLKDPLPLSMPRLMAVIKNTHPSVSETQRKEYLEVKEKMENRQSNNERKRVGFLA